MISTPKGGWVRSRCRWSERPIGVLLGQIKSGGIGLNIQAASVVILAEPRWTPSSEVQVHRLLAKDSIYERIRDVQPVKTAAVR
jgi:SNF2 family DNA or RNA helicase